ncbi:hypothetical protein KOI40_13850 [Aestuariicella sp. G3-2]|uniref:hypothetical protein n=1 Tax=Pseudomaricurvus albidus TaxID=2842452 RepID=UPI001C0E8592|nr:hypothetical protein [Aestuariicella albida]MBU3070904.1 hypothetical protein [Aestuariicella albida]
MPASLATPGITSPSTDNTHAPSQVMELMAVKKGLQRVGNSPRAYRSKAFAEWHRQAKAFYQTAEVFGVSQEINEQFLQRRFGQARAILNDVQIFELFKQDVQATLTELDYLMSCYQEMGEPPQPSEDSRSWWGHISNKGVRLKWLFLGLILVSSAIVLWAL